jgi:RimJ/RimL family protein N-acetyltransferase
MTAPQELHTPRLVLRSLQREDAPAIARLAGAREVASTTLRIPHPYAEADALQFLTNAGKDFQEGRSVVFAITIAPNQDLCGTIGLHIAPEHRHAELGYWIGVPFWGKGYTTEAAGAVLSFGFETLGLHRIYAHYFGGNVASQRVLQKIGMRREGRFRQHIRKWNEFIDIENYAILAEEFRSARSS